MVIAPIFPDLATTSPLTAVIEPSTIRSPPVVTVITSFQAVPFFVSILKLLISSLVSIVTLDRLPVATNLASISSAPLELTLNVPPAFSISRFSPINKLPTRTSVATP